MLIRLLWQLTEAGDPALMLGRPGGGPDQVLFERLLERGVLRHAGQQTTWDSCEGCDCGRQDRPVRWLEGHPTAVCVVDRSADLVLTEDDLLTFEVMIPELVSATAEASGFAARPEEVAPGIWRVGPGYDKRVVYLVPTRQALRRPGLVGALRETEPTQDIIVLGPSLDQRSRTDLRRQGVQHLVLHDHAGLPGASNPLTINLAETFVERADQIRLLINKGNLTATFDDRSTKLSARAFDLLLLLAQRLHAGRPVVSASDIHEAIFSPATSAMRVRGLMRDLRDRLKTELRTPADLIETRSSVGYAITLKAKEVSIQQ